MCQTVQETFINLIAKHKEDDAYRFLHEQYYALLLKFATGFLKAKEPAEEVVHDVLFKIWLKRENVKEINNLRIYLFTAVRNLCLTIITKHKREQDIMTDISAEKAGLIAHDPESIFISSELQERIKTTINDLPPRCKLIYEMIRIEGLKNKDVAEKLKISVNTIDVQLAIALKRLVQTVNIFNQKEVLFKKCK